MKANVPPAASVRTPAVDHGAPALRRLASVGGGVVVSILILVGISRAQKTQIPPQLPLTGELRMTVIEPPPPAPPVANAPPSLTSAPEFEFEAQPESDGLEITATILPRSIPAPPIPDHMFEISFDAFKMGGEITAEENPNHVFEASQVNERPVPLYRKSPIVPRDLLKNVDKPRVTLLFVVNQDGTVGDIRVLRAPSREIGEIMVQAVEEWKFRPAMKSGRKVRCLVQLPIFVSQGSRSPFSVY